VQRSIGNQAIRAPIRIHLDDEIHTFSSAKVKGLVQKWAKWYVVGSVWYVGFTIESSDDSAEWNTVRQFKTK